MIKVLKFYTDTCPPCRMMNPIVEAVVNELDNIYLESINAVEQPEVAKRFDVTNVPTLIVLKNAVVVGRKTGLMPRPALKQWLEELNS